VVSAAGTAYLFKDRGTRTVVNSGESESSAEAEANVAEESNERISKKESRKVPVLAEPINKQPNIMPKHQDPSLPKDWQSALIARSEELAVHIWKTAIDSAEQFLADVEILIK